MNFSKESLGNLLGPKTRARYKNEAQHLESYFENPIIHRQIHGDEIYVPLNLDRVWNRIR